MTPKRLTQLRSNRVLEDTWLTKGCPKNIHIVQQDLDCTGELRFLRFGPPTSPGYDGTHMRGTLAVQHYTGSVITALLKVIPDCNSGSNGTLPSDAKTTPQPFYQSHPNLEPRRSNYYAQAQPQHVAQPPNYHGVPHQYQQKTYTTPVTGVNSTPLGGKYYNVKTQNKFSQVSGN